MNGHDHDVSDRLELSSGGWKGTEEATECLCGERHEIEHHSMNDEILLLGFLLQLLDTKHVLIVMADIGSLGDVRARRHRLLVVGVDSVESNKVSTP